MDCWNTALYRPGIPGMKVPEILLSCHHAEIAKAAERLERRVSEGRISRPNADEILFF